MSNLTHIAHGYLHYILFWKWHMFQIFWKLNSHIFFKFIYENVQHAVSLSQTHHTMPCQCLILWYLSKQNTISANNSFSTLTLQYKELCPPTHLKNLEALIRKTTKHDKITEQIQQWWDAPELHKPIEEEWVDFGKKSKPVVKRGGDRDNRVF